MWVWFGHGLRLGWFRVRDGGVAMLRKNKSLCDESGTQLIILKGTPQTNRAMPDCKCQIIILFIDRPHPLGSIYCTPVMSGQRLETSVSRGDCRGWLFLVVVINGTVSDIGRSVHSMGPMGVESERRHERRYL